MEGRHIRELLFPNTNMPAHIDIDLYFVTSVSSLNVLGHTITVYARTFREEELCGKKKLSIGCYIHNNAIKQNFDVAGTLTASGRSSPGIKLEHTPNQTHQYGQ